MTGVWTESGIKAPGSGFKFENDGDMVSGVLARWEYLDIEASEGKEALNTIRIYLTQKDGSETEVGLLGMDLRAKFAKVDPSIGDWVKIKRVGKAGNKVIFDVDYKSAPAATTRAVAAVVDDSDVPF